MRKGKNVIGKDVISFVDGQKLSSVKDLIIAGDNKTIVALLVDEGGLFGSAKIVPIENAVSFGKDAVVVSDANAVISADTYPAVAAVLDRNDKLLGKKVFTEGGDEHGSISDIYFEENTGEIQGFEVSGGLVEDVKRGAPYLPFEDLLNIGPDVVLIKSEAVYAMDAQVEGVQGALETAKEKTGEAVDAAKQKAGEAAQTVRFRAGEVADKAGGAAEDAAIGKRAGQDVEADNGRIIVARGQRITREHVDEARNEGKLAALLGSVGLGGATEASAATGEALGDVGDKAGRAAGQAADTAGSLWDQFTRKVSEMTDSAGKRLDEEQTKKKLSDIQDAIGRPVTKVILDRQDNVILNLGDIITHQAVQQAHEAGMLDTLLENVYKGEVEFSRDEMMAPQPGQATVEQATGDAQIVDELEQKVEQAQQEREQEREQKRAEAEDKRQAREQEREQRQQQRESEAEMGKSASAGKSVRDPLAAADTEAHQQAKIDDEEFERARKRSGAEADKETRELPETGATAP